MSEVLRFSRPEPGKRQKDIQPSTLRRFDSLVKRVLPRIDESDGYVDRSLGGWIFSSGFTQEVGLPETSRRVHEITGYPRLERGGAVQIDYSMEVTFTSEGVLKIGRPERIFAETDAAFYLNSSPPEQTPAELAEIDVFAKKVLEQYGFPLPEEQILPANLYEASQTQGDLAIDLMHEGNSLAQRILSDEEFTSVINYMTGIVERGIQQQEETTRNRIDTMTAVGDMYGLSLLEPELLERIKEQSLHLKEIINSAFTLARERKIHGGSDLGVSVLVQHPADGTERMQFSLKKDTTRFGLDSIELIFPNTREEDQTAFTINYSDTKFRSVTEPDLTEEYILKEVEYNGDTLFLPFKRKDSSGGERITELVDSPENITMLTKLFERIVASGETEAPEPFFSLLREAYGYADVIHNAGHGEHATETMTEAKVSPDDNMVIQFSVSDSLEFNHVDDLENPLTHVIRGGYKTGSYFQELWRIGVNQEGKITFKKSSDDITDADLGILDLDPDTDFDFDLTSYQPIELSDDFVTDFLVGFRAALGNRDTAQINAMVANAEQETGGYQRDETIEQFKAFVTIAATAPSMMQVTKSTTWEDAESGETIELRTLVIGEIPREVLLVRRKKREEDGLRITDTEAWDYNYRRKPEFSFSSRSLAVPDSPEADAYNEARKRIESPEVGNREKAQEGLEMLHNLTLSPSL